MNAGPRPGVLRTPAHAMPRRPLLLNGEPTWGYLDRKRIAPFEDAGFRVIVPDLIGFGRSDKPVDPEAYTYSQHVAWVTRLVAALDLHGATFFGQD